MGDEGDPGAFMDRILLESYPLRVIEGKDYSRICRRCEGRNILYPCGISRKLLSVNPESDRESCVGERNWVGDRIFEVTFLLRFDI